MFQYIKLLKTMSCGIRFELGLAHVANHPDSTQSGFTREQIAEQKAVFNAQQGTFAANLARQKADQQAQTDKAIADALEELYVKELAEEQGTTASEQARLLATCAPSNTRANLTLQEEEDALLRAVLKAAFD
jgi:hypothetical protein